MSEPRHIYSPTNHHQQEIREAKVQHLASDPSGWGDAVPWYLTTINRVKMMSAGVARIIPFLANSGAPTAIGINRPGSRGSSGDAAAIDHEHGTPDIATETTSGWMGSSQVVSLNANTAHRNATGNPHGTQIADIPGLSSTLSAKADLVNGLIPLSQIPGSLEDLIEYPTRNDFPATGQSGTIYLALDTNHQWRWSGSQYIDMTSESGDQYNMGTVLQGNGDALSDRQNYDPRGGVRSGETVGPFGSAWYNIVDARYRNSWTPGAVFGGELVWGMTAHQNRMAFRSRSADGTPTAWTEVSTVGHWHAISDVTGLQGALDDRLARIPVDISNGNANSVLANGIYSGYSVANAPNPSWGILRVYRAGNDAGDQVWQTWTSAAYSTNQEYRRSSYDFGASWTPWMTAKELDGLGQMHNISWPSRANASWFRIGSIRVVNQYDSGIFSGIIVAGAGSSSYSDNAAYLVSARLKQQDPMTSPIHIIELSWSQLTGAARYRFGYVVSVDSASEKVISIYGQRFDAYTSTNAAILTQSGNLLFYPNDVTETEPPGIVYVDRSISAPTQKRVFLIGNGSATHFKLNHGLGTKSVQVSVRMTAAPRSKVECVDDLDGDDPANSVWVGFEGYVPGNNEFEVTVIG